MRNFSITDLIFEGSLTNRPPMFFIGSLFLYSSSTLIGASVDNQLIDDFCSPLYNEIDIVKCRVQILFAFMYTLN